MLPEDFQLGGSVSRDGLFVLDRVNLELADPDHASADLVELVPGTGYGIICLLPPF